jgi:hypothetical protein
MCGSIGNIVQGLLGIEEPERPPPPPVATEETEEDRRRRSRLAAERRRKRAIGAFGFADTIKTGPSGIPQAGQGGSKSLLGQ